MAEGTDAKLQFLQSSGALHTRPQQVRDPLFIGSEFFDPRDLVQVRYEMLRRHRIEGRPVAQVARAFGTSRQFFYLLERAFGMQGLPGLLPRKRGPKHARKCSVEVLELVQQRRRQDPPAPWDQLVTEVQTRWGVRVHPRTLQRAARGVKKGASRRPMKAPRAQQRRPTRRGATRNSGQR
jgi:transposase